MCAPLTLQDEFPEDIEAMRALEAVVAAEFRRMRMAVRIANGATRLAFPHHDADEAILDTIGAVTAARNAMDRLIVSRAMGERCVLSPTAQLQGIELQRRVTKNEEAKGIPARSLALAAIDAVDVAEADEGLCAMAKSRGLAILDFLPAAPFPDAYQSGFTSPEAA